MNQSLSVYRIHDNKLVVVNDEEAKFETYYNGFKIVFINENIIRHVHINDTELRNKPLISDKDVEYIVQSLHELLHDNFDLAVTSDIHLHVFHFKLMIALSQSSFIKRVVINGDLLLKWDYFKQPYSRKNATNEICKIINDNIDLFHIGYNINVNESDVDEHKIVYLSGNHDKLTSTAVDSFKEGVFSSPKGEATVNKYPKLKDLYINLPWIYTTKIGKYTFRVQHGAYLDSEDPKDPSINVDIIRPEFDAFMEKNSYLILGHESSYYLYKMDDVADKYFEETKHRTYEIDIGSYKIKDENAEDGPIYINMMENKPYDKDLTRYIALDLFWECEQKQIEKGSHLICTDNFRLITPVKAPEKIYQFEMFGGETKHINLWIWIIAVFIIICVVIITFITIKIDVKNRNDNENR